MKKGKKGFWNCRVYFTVSRDVPNVNPPFKAGNRDSIWISTREKSKLSILDAAKRKLDLCYGLELLDAEIGQDGFWSGA